MESFSFCTPTSQNEIRLSRLTNLCNFQLNADVHDRYIQEFSIIDVSDWIRQSVLKRSIKEGYS